MAQPSRSLWLRTFFAASALLAVACGDSETTNPVDPVEPSEPGEQPGDEPLTSDDGAFESSKPGQSSGGDDLSSNGSVATDSAESVGGPSSPASPGAPPPNGQGAAQADDGSASAERAIEEADIIKLEGNLLYALSRYGGLSVIDVSDPSNLRSLGRHKVMATPFEMYVRDGTAFVLYNGYGEYEYDADTQTYTWYQTSYVIALDASDPAAVRETGRFPLAGYISDSRIVGDVLYVAAFEDGYCWGCGNGPRTNLMSLDVADPSAIAKLDELSFEETENTYGWKKSLMATDERMYLAGPAWGATEQPEGSVIQVVDISDPTGDMVLGASVEVGGQIESRWQMDEYEGFLRVISQPFTWRTDLVPVIETFTVESSDVVTPLASLPMVLPRPERLQSVRFDGERAYAITFEQTDPLFTIDLRNPAAPVQAGELEMPGWVYYMHPHGDRVLGLGFDQGNPEGSLTVSLFDVSDLSTPTMLDRVNFGGDWASLAEDQDRIHKAFNVMDEQNLVLVPFSGWSYTENMDETGYYCGLSEYQSGVQLVDWDDVADSLTLRGVAPARGQARRGFVHNDALFTMSDDRLEAFDIGDRDAPGSRDQVALALRVDQTAGSGDTLVQVGYDWWTNVAEITTRSLSNPNAMSGTELELPQVTQTDCYTSSYLGDIRSGDDAVYFLYHNYSYDPVTGQSENGTRIVTVDISDPESPSIAGDTDLGFTPNYYYGWAPGLVSAGQPLVSAGNTLVFANHEYEYDSQGNLNAERHGVKVVDLSEPSETTVTNVELPFGLGGTGLLLSDDVVATSHFEPSPTNTNRVRFYLDRVDISDPTNPVALPPVNVPGSVVAYDAPSERALTVDYREIVTGSTERQCYEVHGGWFDYPGTDYANYDYENTLGTCHAIIQTLRLVDIDDGSASVIDSYELNRGESVGVSALGDDRVFISLGGGSYYGYATTDVAAGGVGISPGYYGYSTFASGTADLLVLGGLRSGEFEVSRLSIETGNGYYGSLDRVVAVGDKAVVASGWQGKLSVIDASDASAPRILRDVDVPGYVQDLDVFGNVAVASMGYDGVQSITLE